MADIEQRAWFRPKRYGYGAEPANWKGWLAAGIHLAVFAGIVWRLVSEQAHPAPVSEQAVLWWTALIVATLAFLVLCWMKTDGKWRWRWGQDD